MPLDRHSEIGGAVTHSEREKAPRSWEYDPGFYSRLETWLEFWDANTPTSWSSPRQLWGYGAYVNKPGYHGSGRAVDISRIFVIKDGTLAERFNGRTDQWGGLTPGQRWEMRRKYWATSASLHYHFSDVLTYHHDQAHENHIHVDNGRSGSGNSRFSTGRRNQVWHVQSCCRYVWGYDTGMDGIWGPETDTDSRAALERIGRSGALTTSQANWLAFNRATTRFGTRRQTY
ncbi:extensin family protein [Rhodococcus sp. DMU1]|uniref:extensin family protein n=1 Tax=Rhodococcus sp. DMU1 TaxID=2722825 RepID=UPI00143E1A8D|nr:extensin family protein [Rhodococcus sp. DMU1]QIX53910.1 hypothetical protein HFP48_30605 [Rhodococcus sp. DMU1]